LSEMIQAKMKETRSHMHITVQSDDTVTATPPSDVILLDEPTLATAVGVRGACQLGNGRQSTAIASITSRRLR